MRSSLAFLSIRNGRRKGEKTIATSNQFETKYLRLGRRTVMNDRIASSTAKSAQITKFAVSAPAAMVESPSASSTINGPLARASTISGKSV